MSDLNNQGYKPKSEVSAKEREEFDQYRKELLALPPANSNENATKHRAFLVKHYPFAEAHFKLLNLPY